MSEIKVITESFWLDNLRDRIGVTLREFLNTLDKDEAGAAKEMILAHAKDLPNMYDIHGRPDWAKPMFLEHWHGKHGLYAHAKSRFSWLHSPESARLECSNANDLANDFSWKADHNARDWREAKELKQQSAFWRNRGYDLLREIHGSHYESPACLI